MSVSTASRENGRGRPRGYDLDYRPHRATLVLLDQVREVIDEYRDHLPLTVRQIFYRLVGQHGYEKTEDAYERLGDKLVRARRAKLIPFDVIRDDGIITIRNTFYGSVEDFHDETAYRARAYQRDRQQGQHQYIELYCEAGGMIQQLDRVAAPYSIQVYSGSGFDSLTGKYEVALRALDRDVPTVILHVGDFDPSGESIFAAMTEDAAEFVEADRVIQTQAIIAERVALTREQVELYQLETSPPKKTDQRSKNWKGGTCQLEALAPDLLAEIVRTAINGIVEGEAYYTQVKQEDRERAELLALPPGDAP